jgi:hypothetical protein
MQKFIIIGFLFIANNILAQVSNTGIMDTISGKTLKKITISGYLDMYYGVTFSKTHDNSIPYFVSMARNNEATINLALIDFRYNTKNLRARFVPGFGTYMNANYATEQGSLKNIVEASAGVKLSTTKEIWLDAGVLGSPYTNESAISKDHLMYTRSLAPEYVPYYLAGVKLSIPLNKKFNAYLYFLNGWQQIQDANSGKSIGTQLEYRPNDNNLINWNTYVGDERSEILTNYRMRYFTDFYWIYNKNKISVTSCFYIGNQKKIEFDTTYSDNIWWQINFITKYSFTDKLSISGRLEYFNDNKNVFVQSINSSGGFNTLSGGVCMNLKLNENAIFRLEGRHFLSENNLFIDSDNNPSKHMNWFISNLTFWF